MLRVEKVIVLLGHDRGGHDEDRGYSAIDPVGPYFLESSRRRRASPIGWQFAHVDSLHIDIVRYLDLDMNQIRREQVLVRMD